MKFLEDKICETNSSHLKIDGWNTPIFGGRLLGSREDIDKMIALFFCFRSRGLLLILLSPRLPLGSIKGCPITT